MKRDQKTCILKKLNTHILYEIIKNTRNLNILHKYIKNIQNLENIKIKTMKYWNI